MINSHIFYQERSYHLYRQNKYFFVSFEILIRIIELVLNNYKFQLENHLFLIKNKNIASHLLRGESS